MITYLSCSTFAVLAHTKPTGIVRHIRHVISVVNSKIFFSISCGITAMSWSRLTIGLLSRTFTASEKHMALSPTSVNYLIKGCAGLCINKSQGPSRYTWHLTTDLIYSKK